MIVERSVLVGFVCVAICASLFLFSDVISWGFTTLSDCIDVDFDPACYSKTANDSAGGSSGKMWWPHE